MEGVFCSLDMKKHDKNTAPIFISGTHVLRLYYSHLLAKVTSLACSTAACSPAARPSELSKNSTKNPNRPSSVKHAPLRVLQTHPVRRQLSDKQNPVHKLRAQLFRLGAKFDPEALSMRAVVQGKLQGMGSAQSSLLRGQYLETVQ